MARPAQSADLICARPEARTEVTFTLDVKPRRTDGSHDANDQQAGAHRGWQHRQPAEGDELLIAQPHRRKRADSVDTTTGEPRMVRSALPRPDNQTGSGQLKCRYTHRR